MVGYDVVPQADGDASESDLDEPADRRRASSFQPLPLDFDNLGDDDQHGSRAVLSALPSASTVSRSTTSYDVVEDDDYNGYGYNDDDGGEVAADHRLGKTMMTSDRRPSSRAATHGQSRDDDDDDHNVLRSSHDIHNNSDNNAAVPTRKTPSPHHSPASTTHSSAPPLAHPTPDLQSLQGAYVGNVERLEKSAESFVDVSSASPPPPPLAHPPPPPGGYDSTENTAGLARSRASRATTYSQQSGGLHSPKPPRPRRASRPASGSAAVPQLERAVTEPAANDLVQQPFEQSTAPTILLPPPPPPPETSAAQSPQPSSYPHHLAPPDQITTMQQDPAASTARRPASAGSTETYRQATDLFEDFDGVHFTLHRDNSANSRRISLSKPPLARNSEHHKESVPGQNMVYYPAPVPKVLNLPQRLGKKPAAVALSEQEKRRTQIVGAMGPEARKSAAWLANDPDNHQQQQQQQQQQAGSAPENKRQSKVPPQLRASAFFEQPPAQLDVQLKQDSAVATLDSILDAAASAPVRAFTDHPIVGGAGADVYGRRKGKRLHKNNKQKHRSTATQPYGARDSVAPSLNPVRIVSEGDEEGDEREGQAAAAAQEATPFRKSYVQQHEDRRPSPDRDRMSTSEGRNDDYRYENSGSKSSAQSDEEGSDGDDDDEDGSDGDDEQDEEEIPGGAPTTLLAELQTRQKEQKQRNRTAATAFPNGMHSTLLELDAVAQRQRQTRNQKHVTLAWEDPEVEEHQDQDDEDVPLGVLFPEKTKAAEEQRPVGLMGQLKLDENEPLSRRRARMRGEDPDASRRPSPADPAAATSAQRDSTAYTIDIPGLEEKNTKNNNSNSDDDEGETLAQRLKRLKSREGATAQAATQAPDPLSSDFASEVLSTIQPAVSAKPKDKKGHDPGPNGGGEEQDEAEETLGQRRKRLQAASGAAHNRNKSNLTTGGGMANVGATPTGNNYYSLPNNNNNNGVHQVPYQTPPVVPDSGPGPVRVPIGGVPHANRMSMAAAGSTTTTAVPAMMQGQPIAAAPAGYPNMPYNMPHNANPPQTNAALYGNGMSSINPAYYPHHAAAAANRRSHAASQMQAQMQMPAEQPETIDPQQRAMIDRWRLSVR